MKVPLEAAVAAALIALPVAIPSGARAQSNDAAYCQALVAKYDQYLNSQSRREMTMAGDSGARLSAEQCRKGDAAGIPGLEKALKNARIDLPPRS